MFNSAVKDNAKANYLTSDIINKCKTKIDPKFNEIRQKYKNISINDAYIICSYTCESKEEKYSPYKLLNQNLVSNNRKLGVNHLSSKNKFYLFLN